MTTPLEQIKNAREDAKAIIELRDHLDKLQKNRSFNAVFTEFVFKELPAKSAKLFNSPGINQVTQQNIENTFTMISSLNHMLSNIHTQADHAQQTLYEIDEAEAEYLAQVGDE